MAEDEFITTAEKEERKVKAVKRFKIAIFVAFVLAAVGVGFGVYSIIEVVEKNDQIAKLKAQINNDHGIYPNHELGNDGEPLDPRIDSIDINTDQKISLYHYSSFADGDDQRYTLIISQTADNTGFFNLIRTGQVYQEAGSGYVTFDGDIMTLKVGPFVEGNDFTNITNIAKFMGFSIETKTGIQENYKAYSFEFYEDSIKLGNIELVRVD